MEPEGLDDYNCMVIRYYVLLSAVRGLCTFQVLLVCCVITSGSLYMFSVQHESVVHVLWECPAYKDNREGFMVKLRAILGEVFEDFKVLDNIDY